jgi:hypothetical protein
MFQYGAKWDGESETINKVVKNAVSPVTEQKICALRDEKEAQKYKSY